MQPPGSQGELKLKNWPRDRLFFTLREVATFSRTQNPIMEIYLGTLQLKDFPYLPICFIAICKI